MANTDDVLYLDRSYIAEWFYYDETSETCLRFNKDLYRGRGRGYLYKSKGSEAGTKVFMRGNKRHCIRVNVYGIGNVQVHRIIWTLICGDIKSGHVIDHIDGNPFNNRISNLREIPTADNTRNSKRREDNKTGVNGVFRTKPGYRRGDGCYMAFWNDKTGKRVSRAFAIRKYGEEQALKLAVEARNKGIEELKTQGIYYSDRHGTDIEIIEHT